MSGHQLTQRQGAACIQRDRARGGLLVFGLFLLPLSLVGYWFLDTTQTSLPLNLPSLPLMMAPAAAALSTRLLRHEGLTDGSSHLRSQRVLGAVAFGLGLPLLVGTLAYGAAYLTGLARLVPPHMPLLPDSAGPLAHVTAVLTVAATLGTLVLLPSAAGEEIGWRGYLLPRLIAAGAPHPILLSGLIWGLWHLVPLVVSGYAVGPVAALSAAGLLLNTVSLGAVLAWLRLDTGRIWPAVVSHAAWNAVINGGFDLATAGEDAALWTGEAGGLVTLVLGLVTLTIGGARRQWRASRSG